MAIYSERDIAFTQSGDLSVNARGDLELASSYESQKAAINFLVKTNKGEYIPDNRIGCDAGTFIGRNQTRENISAMEAGVIANLSDFVIARSDLSVNIIPVERDVLGLFVGVQGEYIGSDGNLLDLDPELLTFTFPYLEGFPTPQP